MHLIDGTALSARLREALKDEILASGTSPHLKVMLVGDDKASHLYVSLKQKRAEEVGIRLDVHTLPADTPDHDLVALIEKWNHDPDVHAILVQLPLPQRETEQRIIDAIDPKKDVDGFHPQNIAALIDGTATVIPPLHEGILRLINEAPVMVNGAHAAIIANTDVFAEPLAHLLTTAGAKVNIMRPDDLDSVTLKEADIIVVVIGRTHFLTSDLVKDGAVIIDVGTNKQPDGTVCGDVDRASFADRAVYLTPAPGGVGPMTIAQLLRNVFSLYLQQTKSETP